MISVTELLAVSGTEGEDILFLHFEGPAEWRRAGHLLIRPPRGLVSCDLSNSNYVEIRSLPHLFHSLHRYKGTARRHVHAFHVLLSRGEEDKQLR